MKIKKFTPKHSPSDIIRMAFRKGRLDDRDLCVYEGLDDEGFALKRQRILNQLKLEQMASGDDEDCVPGGDWRGECANQHYADYDDCPFNYYSIFDDDGGLIGYYVLFASPVMLDGFCKKAFVFADEAGTRNANRIMFMLLNRLSEAKRQYDRLSRDSNYDMRDVMKRNAPIEFDWGDARFASGSGRPKKAGYYAALSDFDRFLIKSENDRAFDGARARTAGAGSVSRGAGLGRSVHCPEGIRLE